jgi:putative tryptophan/tyrosine transport system substrate-binding protein
LLALRLHGRSPRAQQSAMPVIGVLVNNPENDQEAQRRIAVFRQAIAQFGWVEGRNVRIELRFSEGNYERLPELVQDMVALQPDVIFVNTTPALKVLQAKTRTIPLVFTYVSDPVGSMRSPTSLHESRVYSQKNF